MAVFLVYEKTDSERWIDQLMEEDTIAIASVCITASNSCNLFTDDELLNEDQNFVDPEDGVRDQLILLQRTPSYFRIITNFSGEEIQRAIYSGLPDFSYDRSFYRSAALSFWKTAKAISSAASFIVRALFEARQHRATERIQLELG